ncbi:MAG: hypothetical protein IJ449_05200 [Clostridia bacterium]|nr:hypothetical protein [Clostridia bacterium]
MKHTHTAPKHRFCIGAALALLLLATAAISACADADTVSDTVTTAAPQTGETTEAIETEAPEYTAPGADYGGESFTVGAVDYERAGRSFSWKAAGYCEVFTDEENGDPINDAIYQRNLAIAETLNVKLDLYLFSELGQISAEFRKLVLAAEDVMDIAMVNAVGLPNVIGSGLLVDLNTLPGVDFTHSWWDQTAREEMTILDSMYAATGDISLFMSFAPISYFYNKHLVETLDLEDPYTLVRSGTWTLDKAIEYSTAAASDLNGDGNMDPTQDRFGMLCESTSLIYAAHAAGVNLTSKDSEGAPYLDVALERAVSLTDTLVPFFNDSSVTLLSNYQKGYNNVFTDLFLPMFQEDRAMFYNNQLLVALNLRDMNTDFGILPPPKLDEAQKDYLCPINDHWGTFAVMPVTNSNAEMTGHVLEAMGYYGQKYVISAYIETTVLDKAIRDEDSAEMVSLILDNRVYDLASFYNWGGINTLFSTLATSPNKEYTSELAKIEKKVNKLIAETVDTIREEQGE